MNKSKKTNKQFHLSKSKIKPIFTWKNIDNFHIYNETFNYGCCFYFNIPLDHLIKYLNKTYPNNGVSIYNNSNGLFHYNIEKDIVFIWLKEFKFNTLLISILSHEIHHLVKGICDIKGINDEETSAYLLEYFMRKVLERYKK